VEALPSTDSGQVALVAPTSSNRTRFREFQKKTGAFNAKPAYLGEVLADWLGDAQHGRTRPRYRRHADAARRISTHG
jgi:hypothetical protein